MAIRFNSLGTPQILIIRLLLLASAYFITGRLGLLLPFFGTSITLIWLPTGIAVAALLRWGNICWPAILAGALATNLAIGSPPLLAASIALGNTLGPLLAAGLLRKLAFHSEFDHARDILLLGIAAAIGMAVSAGGGVSSLVLFNMLPVTDVVPAWLSWWAGDFTGVLLAAPLLLNISRAELTKLWEQRLEFLVWCLVAIAMGWEVFLINNDANGYSLPLAFIMLPLGVWSAMRFGVMGSSLGLLLPVVIAAWATSLGLGPFGTTDVRQGLFLLWLFLVTLSLIGLMVVALQAGRKRAEDRLKVALQHEAEALNELRVMLNASGEGFWKIDQSGRIVEINDAYCRITGYARDEVVGAHISKFEFIEQTHEAAAARMRLIVERGYDRFETKHRHRDGHLVDIEVTSSFVAETNCFVVLLRDVTERKRAEALMQQFGSLLQNSFNEIYLFDASTLYFIQVSEGAKKNLGYSADELKQLTPLDIKPLFTRESFEQLIAPLRKGEQQSLHFETVHRRKDGTTYPVEIGLQLMTTTFLAVIQDITERKRVEEEMRIAAATFETQEAILIADPEANILRVNRAFEVLAGYSAEELIGQNPRILQSGRHDAAFYQAMWAELLDTGMWAGEIWDKRKNGEIYPKYMTITAVYDDLHQLTHYVAVSSDISQRKQSEQEIHQLAFYDPLTKLPNRRLLMDRLQQAMAVSMRSGRHGALLFMDLDRFKIINDTQGHAAGDLLLVEVARRLQSCVREGDSVARLGGDEFVVVLEELSHQTDEAATQTELVAEKIRNDLNQPCMLGDYECRTTPSIGISLFCGHLESAEDLLKHADIAMYQAKAAGRNAIRFFDPQMQEVLEKRAALETDLRQALARQQFHLYYQIQVDSLHRPLGAEVLLRWKHPERGFVFPDQFIPLAEETGLIVPMGLWVLQTACARINAWQHDALTRDLTIAVNVSANQFHQADFVAQMRQVLLESGAKPSLLKLELTESTVLENVQDTIAKMREIKLLGVSFSMDDFGTGYSSLQYLKRLPLDQIKIDQSFVRDIVSDPNDAAIVQTIIAMTEALGLEVIAEGVETGAQRDFLDKCGCHAFQGYLFSKPVPVEEFEALLKR